MNPAPLPPELLAAAPGLARQVGIILHALGALIARGLLRDPLRVGHINALWSYINRTVIRFERVMARLAAGSLRPAAPRPGRASSGSSPVRLPTARAWLVIALRHDAAGHASQLRHVLDRPETAALLAAAPQAVRLLRPLCHLLGLDHPLLKPPPRPAPAPRPRRPAPSPAPPEPDPAPALRLPDCPRLRLRWPWSAMRLPAAG